MFKRWYFLIGLVLALSVGCGKEQSEEFVWGNLKNLGPNINSPGKDEHVTLTRDGKTMYFASIRVGGLGNYDIYMSEYRNGAWTKAVCLPSPVNTKKDDFDPFITLDGKRLFFASNRDNPGHIGTVKFMLVNGKMMPGPSRTSMTVRSLLPVSLIGERPFQVI